MLNKPKTMKQRLPSLVVPDEMMAQLSRISEKEEISLSETVRQGLSFFLANYVSSANTSVSEASKEGEG